MGISRRPGALPDGLLTAEQLRIAAFAGPGSLAVTGLPGTGKTTALQACLAGRLAEGLRPDRALVLVPGRAHVQRYEQGLVELLGRTGSPIRGGLDLVTFYGFCQRQVALYWPLVADAAGFRRTDREPVFLTLESAQYYMWRIVEPLVAERGYFGDVSVRRGRLLSQLIDNLNKAALVGFDHREIAQRLSAAWTGTPERLNTFRQAEECAGLFRAYCLEHGLLDFSLVSEVFSRYLLPHEFFEPQLSRYRLVVVDNIEENVPIAHDLVRALMARCPSTIIAMDREAGYRVFLGADRDGAEALVSACQERLDLGDRPQAGSGGPLRFARRIAAVVDPRGGVEAGASPAADAVAAHGGETLWIGMVRWVAGRVAALVQEGVPPGQIAIIAPYVSDVMRFTLQDALAHAPRPIAVQPLRPALALRSEPIIRGTLALARLAHPGWAVTLMGTERQVRSQEVALGLEQAIEGLDPVRAHRLAALAWAPGQPGLAELVEVPADDRRATPIARMWEKVGFRLRAPYKALSDWMAAYIAREPDTLAVFLSRLFGDILSQPGFALHRNTQGARAYGRLVESALKFGSAVAEAEAHGGSGGRSLGADYVSLVLGDIASAEYLSDAPEPGEDAVVLAPAYAWLTRDLSCEWMFWIDLSSEGWWNRPNQPLTHPYVLSRGWQPGRPWTDADEDAAQRRALAAVLVGLAARCSRGLYLASSQLGAGGEEQSGRLERAILAARTR